MQDKVIVITGASSGIGASLAKLVADRGARPILVARREPELQAVAAACGESALVITADVTHRAEVERARDLTLAKWGHIDVWINNAGRGINKSVLDLTDDDFDQMMTVNVKSALYGMQAVLPHFQARNEGHLINISSMLGRIPFATVRSAYNAAKHALNALTGSLRIELRAKYPAIHISLVSPGVVATDFGTSALGGGMDSRHFPGAQPADEVAAVIADVIERPRADVYTRESYRAQVAAYYSAEDMEAIEARFTAPPPPAASKA